LIDWIGNSSPLRNFAVLAMAIAAALILHLVIYRGVRRSARRSGDPVDLSILRNTRVQARLVLVLFAAFGALPVLGLKPNIVAPIRHGLLLALIGSGGWLLVGLSNVVRDLILSRHSVDVQDNLAQREVRTQVQLLHRIVGVVIVVMAVGAMLMTFDEIQRIGLSVLASAGIAGVIIGMAAQPAIGSLIAGIEIALTQPIRLDDVVVVEGQFGRIEEIRTTFVVVRLWDLRRMVLPVRYFLEKPFENWTRSTANLMATAEIHVDYAVPFDELRTELKRILEASGGWDGVSWNLQVVDADERAVTVRALMSAPDAPAAWELRCKVREGLIGYLQRSHPEALPRVRAHLVGDAVGEGDGASLAHSPGSGP
jgi:small-conductance mechanosensitive channel